MHKITTCTEISGSGIGLACSGSVKQIYNVFKTREINDYIDNIIINSGGKLRCLIKI